MTARASILLALATAGRPLSLQDLVAAIYGDRKKLPKNAGNAVHVALASFKRKPVNGKTVVRTAHGFYAIVPVDRSDRRVARSLVGSTVVVRTTGKEVAA